jgi:hypothetical protein
MSSTDPPFDGELARQFWQKPVKLQRGNTQRAQAEFYGGARTGQFPMPKIRASAFEAKREGAKPARNTSKRQTHGRRP